MALITHVPYGIASGASLSARELIRFIRINVSLCGGISKFLFLQAIRNDMNACSMYRKAQKRVFINNQPQERTSMTRERLAACLSRQYARRHANAASDHVNRVILPLEYERVVLSDNSQA